MSVAEEGQISICSDAATAVLELAGGKPSNDKNGGKSKVSKSTTPDSIAFSISCCAVNWGVENPTW